STYTCDFHSKSEARCSFSVPMTEPELIEICGAYSAFTMMGRPSLKRCRPCSLVPSSFNVRGSESTKSPSAESLPQHKLESWRTASTAAAIAAVASFEGAVNDPRLVTRTSCFGKNGHVSPG